jgi:hypothetical protein
LDIDDQFDFTDLLSASIGLVRKKSQTLVKNYSIGFVPDTHWLCYPSGPIARREQKRSA